MKRRLATATALLVAFLFCDVAWHLLRPSFGVMQNTSPLGEGFESERWVTPSGKYCGTVLVDLKTGIWEAYAFNDFSESHYFGTREEATTWLTKEWCRP